MDFSIHGSASFVHNQTNVETNNAKKRIPTTQAKTFWFVESLGKKFCVQIATSRAKTVANLRVSAAILPMGTGGNVKGDIITDGVTGN